jgi:hypothetical protein
MDNKLNQPISFKKGLKIYIIFLAVLLGLISLLKFKSVQDAVTPKSSITTDESYEMNLTERCKDWIYFRNQVYKLEREGNKEGAAKARVAMQKFDSDLQKHFSEKQISDEIARLEASGN